jgi:hypothetical protein
MRKFQRLVNVLASPCVDICMVFDNGYMKEVLDWELNGSC